jgi:hypothetical protein
MLPLRPLSESSPTRLPEPIAGSAAEALTAGIVTNRALPSRDSGENQPAPWTRAADASITAGRASQAAGVATAGFFRRFAKKIADSF